MYLYLVHVSIFSTVSIFSGPNHDSVHCECKEQASGDVMKIETGEEDNYSQVTTFWNKVCNTQYTNIR